MILPFLTVPCWPCPGAWRVSRPSRMHEASQNSCNHRIFRVCAQQRSIKEAFLARNTCSQSSAAYMHYAKGLRRRGQQAGRPRANLGSDGPVDANRKNWPPEIDRLHQTA